MAQKKEPSRQGKAKNENVSLNNTTNKVELHEELQKKPEDWVMPDLKGANFKKKARYFMCVVYPESASKNWIEQLKVIGIPFSVSPLHDKDINPDGERKKAHYHVIFTYSNTTTLKAFAEIVMPILRCPIPQICASVKGAYRYHTHADNPEKYQYEPSEIQNFCGFEIPIDAKDVREIMRQIERYAIDNSIFEYAEMSLQCQLIPEWYDVFTTHTIHFSRWMSSFRNNPERVLKKYKEILEEESQK